MEHLCGTEGFFEHSLPLYIVLIHFPDFISKGICMEMD